MTRNIKNSAGKIIGTTEISEDKITINNYTKPILCIEDKQIIQSILSNQIDMDIIVILYNDYTLTIGEIASLYNKCYSTINKMLKKDSRIVINKKGRRNRAYGHPVSKECAEKISNSLKGHKPKVYERTPEIRKKISQSLKKYFSEHPQNPEPHIKNWKDGKYDNVDFHIGIGGSIYSLKMKQQIRFRSLLELHYILLLENDNKVISYIYEPFHIPLPNNRSYTPDFLINNKEVIELKSKKYVQRVNGVQEKVEFKAKEAINYCNHNGYNYQIIYDKDLNFDSKTMKKYIRDNPNIVEQYHIIFNDPNRMVLK